MLASPQAYDSWPPPHGLKASSGTRSLVSRIHSLSWNYYFHSSTRCLRLRTKTHLSLVMNGWKLSISLLTSMIIYLMIKTQLLTLSSPSTACPLYLAAHGLAVSSLLSISIIAYYRLSLLTRRWSTSPTLHVWKRSSQRYVFVLKRLAISAARRKPDAIEKVKRNAFHLIKPGNQHVAKAHGGRTNALLQYLHRSDLKQLNWNCPM